MKHALSVAAIFALGASITLAPLGCGDSSLTFPTGGAAGQAGAGPGGAGSGGGGNGGSAQGGGGNGGNGGSAQGGGGSAQGGGGSGGSAQGGAGGGGGQCTTAADCDALLGPAACGQWACNGGTCAASSPGCTDADGDGYGAGVACMCAGKDCDDNDAAIGSQAVQSCYSGPAGTVGVGACQAGTSNCVAGVWSPCSGEVVPGGEACNNQDDDCNGQVDDGLGSFTCGLGACQTAVAACAGGVTGQCVPSAPGVALDGPTCNGVDDDCDGAIDEDCKSCVAVSVAALGVNPDGTFANPFGSIQAAIDWAVAHPAGPQTVCVAAGATCGATGTYKSPNNMTITMANGVSVLGNYESVTWNRCNNSTTVIQPSTGAGVTFPAAVQKTTVLDGFRIERFNTGAAGTTAGVTVDAAKAVILSSIHVPEIAGLNVANSYGINVVNGGDALITKSRIDGGFGSVETIGVRSVGSHVSIQNNCLSLDQFGRCDDFCAGNPSIRGRTQQGTGAAYGVYLQGSPNSSIETSAICATDADMGASIRIAGDGTGILIRSNLVNAFGGLMDSHGIWMEDCNDAAPWIVDNFRIATTGDNQNSRVDGIRAIGACHPVVDSNVQITGGGEGNAANPIGVYCGANAQGQASECNVLGNRRIEGSVNGFPMIATGVRCDDGACNRIENNLITGRGGVVAYGLWLGSTGTLVANNEIRGGCGGVTAGVRAEDAFARLENNRVFGYAGQDCTGAGSGNPTESYGLRVFIAASAHELDVHSNNIDASGPLGAAAACSGRAIAIEQVPGGGAAQKGIFRNNILRAGFCSTSRVGFLEATIGADPRVVQNNDFDPAGSPTALYSDEGGNLLTMVSQVNALADVTASANISADPLFAAYPMNFHLQAGSPCIGAGTPSGAPAYDFEGTPRDAVTPDIGADEM